ncbi:MAG TPA: ABC transporter permease [Acidimicrobiales bacterium]|jgi:ABC-2 type transport system permease protein
MATATELWGYRGLIGNLAQRELKAKYKRSVLGWLWSLINPATTLVIYTIVFGTLLQIEVPVAGNGHTESFALFLFAALVVWNFFNAVLNGSMIALISAGPLLRRVYFPPECPPIANMLAGLIQTLLEVVILVVVLVMVGNLGWTVLLTPFLLVLLGMFSIGVALVASLFNVRYRDVNYLITIALQLLFYATPIIYPYTLVEDKAPRWIEIAVTVNPLTQFVGAARDIFYLQQVPSAGRCLGLLGISLTSLLAGWAIFRAGSRDVIEEL